MVSNGRQKERKKPSYWDFFNANTIRTGFFGKTFLEQILKSFLHFGGILEGCIPPGYDKKHTLNNEKKSLLSVADKYNMEK